MEIRFEALFRSLDQGLESFNMDIDSAPMRDERDYRRRSPSPVRRRFSRSPPPPRDRYRERSPYGRRRYSRSPPPRHYQRRSPPRFPPPRRPREVIRGTEDDRLTTCSIFVGNIPYSFEERDVVNMFERFGRLRQVSVPIDRYTHRNRGFAFIEYEQRADAEDAYNKYVNYEMEGRKLRVDWDIGRSAKERVLGDRPPRRDFRDRRSPPPLRERSPMPARDRSPMPPRDRSPMPLRGSRSPPPRFERERDFDRPAEYR